MSTALGPDALLSAEPVLDSLETTAAELISDCEAKTERVGRILHDCVGQVLSGVGMHLEALRLDLKDRPDLAERAAGMQALLEQAMGEVRSLSSQLNPSVVERAGLLYALEQLAVEYRSRGNSNARVQFDSSIRLPREVAVAFYRVAEYCCRHALPAGGPGRIDMFVKYARGSVALEIRSTGVIPDSLPGADAVTRVDLLKLRFHTARAGVRMVFETIPGKGTIVRTSYRENSGNA